MENALLVGLSRQMVLERQLDVVANNVANMNTTGFKSDNSMFEQYLMPVARENRFGPADRQVDFVNDRGTWRNTRAGSIQQTGNPLDVAINGDGYIAVQTAGGERYTRNGSLQINAQGQLVTTDGSQVMGDSGPIVFQTTDHNIAITPDGRITVVEAGATNTEFDARPDPHRQLRGAPAAAEGRQQQLRRAARRRGDARPQLKADPGLDREVERQRRGRDLAPDRNLARLRAGRPAAVERERPAQERHSTARHRAELSSACSGTRR